MQIMVEVNSEEVRTKTGTSAKTGRPYTIREQEGWLFLPDQPYPQKVNMNLEDGEQPYKPGRYAIAPRSFYVGKFGEMQVRLQLDRSKVADLKAA